MNTRKWRRIAFLGAFAVLLLGTTSTTPGCPVTGGGTAYLRVENHSPYSLTGLYISPSSSPTWGSNWLTYPMTGNTYADFSLAPNTYDLLAHWNEFNGMDAIERNFVLNAGESRTWAVYLKSAGGQVEVTLEPQAPGWTATVRDWLLRLAGV